MDLTDPHCHTTSIEVRCAPETALAYLADGLAQGEWTLGSMQRRRIEEGLFAGTSMFDGSTLYVRIRPDSENLIVYYDVGPDPADLHPRNVIRVVPGPVVGRGEDVCIITFMCWRAAAASEDRWRLSCVSHETEMFIIKARLEGSAA